jgi:uncharacterized membrane protein
MQYRHNPPSLEELRKAVPVPHNTRREFKYSLTLSQQFAVFMTKRIGSMGFFMFLFFWTIIWLGWNIYAPLEQRFDPAPAFVIWLFVSNILQLILLPLIMVGQNIESRAADMRSQADYEIDEKTGRVVEAILQHLENQNELFLELTRKIDRQ